MKKLSLLILCLAGLFFVSCGGGSDGSSKECSSNSDCAIGQKCSSDGVCVSANSAETDGEDENGNSELPDSANNNSKENQDGDSNSDGSEDDGDNTDSTSGDNDSEKNDSGDESDSESSSDDDDDSDSGSGQNAYSDDELIPDGDTCDKVCDTILLDDGCLPNDVDEGSEGLCDGLDNDCDGKVDENCPCTSGQKQPCFMGPPNKRNVGKCKDGTQTCNVVTRAMYGTWGACEGGISPSADVCDLADNDCNGCVDDKLCCAPVLNCSYEIGTASPFVDKIIDGKEIYDTDHSKNDADTAKWEWTLTQGPCDKLLKTVSYYTKGAKTQAELTGDGAQSTKVEGYGLSQFKVRFKLSGDYILHLKVTSADGEVNECDWQLKVVSNGLRVELCWDTNTTVDADLHLGKNGVTTGWQNTTACLYTDCKGDPYGTTADNSKYNWKVSGWGYDKTVNYNKNGKLCDGDNKMPNPRLDLDNICNGAKPENINLDNPRNDDVFRVGVNFYSGGNITTHPLVNIYCGGRLAGTYGEAPNYITDFNSTKDFWKVVQVKWVGGVDSTACELTPNLNVVQASSSSADAPAYSSW